MALALRLEWEIIRKVMKDTGMWPKCRLSDEVSFRTVCECVLACLAWSGWGAVGDPFFTFGRRTALLAAGAFMHA